MKFSIVHPTARVTPELASPWWKAAISAYDGCDNADEVEYILIVHYSRMSSYRSEGLYFGARPWGRFTVIVNYGRDCLVDQWNAGVSAASGEIVIYNQDDIRFPPHWDTEVSKLIPDTSKLACVQAQTDGARRDLLVFPSIATQPLMRAIGLLSSDYESMFSDDEWSAKARLLGTVIQSSLRFEHLHPSSGRAQMDAVYGMESSDEAYRIGRAAFERRSAARFPRVPYPDERVAELRQAGYNVPPSKGMLGRALDWLETHIAGAPALPSATPPRFITFCLPGETFRFEWLSGLVDLCNHVGNAGWLIKLCFGYSTSCYSTRINMAEEVIEAAKTIRPEYVFWLDDDNIVKPDAFLRLLAFLDTTPTADVVAGWCWIRQKDRWGISVGQKFWEDGVHLMPIELDALFAGGPSPKRIVHTGFPCVVMRYAALEKLGAHAFMPILRPDLPTWFAGEDIAWCLRAQDAGLEMWVDPSCKVAHLKTISQEPDIQLFADTPEELKKWREQVNGKAIPVSANVHEVIS